MYRLLAYLLLFQLKYHLRFETNETPGQGIIKVADEEGADMIIIGAREMSKLKKTLLGSVSNYVLRNSKVYNSQKEQRLFTKWLVNWFSWLICWLKVPVVVVPARSFDPTLVTH